MAKKQVNVPRIIGFSLLGLCASFCAIVYYLITTDLSDEGPPPPPTPTRPSVNPTTIIPQTVASRWDFETAYAPRKFTFPSARWIAIDSHGFPAVAYGGSQLYYARFDGTNWISEVVDSQPGAGKFAHLLLDGNDQPHIVYASGIDYGEDRLESMYRDAQGWHHEVILPSHSYYDTNFEIALDGQGYLVMAYELSSGHLDCNGKIISSSVVCLATQTGRGWQIDTISQNGRAPSLAVDRNGMIHLSYQHLYPNSLVEAVRQQDGSWERQDITSLPASSTLALYADSVILVDAGLHSHVIFITLPDPQFRSQPGMTSILNYAWQDETGWHTEKPSTLDYVERNCEKPECMEEFSAGMDADGRISVIISDALPRLLRRDANGWQESDLAGSEIGQDSAFTLAVDTKNQLHLAYFDPQDYTIHYATEQGGQWQTSQVDRGNQIWSGADLAFDQNGQMHISLGDRQGVVHYLSRELNGWQDEVVSPIHPNEFTYLLFDLQNTAHIFYMGQTLSIGNSPATGGLVHANREAAGWKYEYVPLKYPEEIPYFILPVLTPEGWPAFVENRDEGTDYFYLSPDGWEDLILPNIQSYYHQSLLCLPQVVYPGGTFQTVHGRRAATPGIYYCDRKANVLKYSYPAGSTPVVVPLLGQGDELDSALLNMQLSPKGGPVFFASIGGNMNFASYETGRIQTYMLKGVDLPWLGPPLIDSQGMFHLAYMDTSQSQFSLVYLTGRAADWTKTQFSGAPRLLKPEEWTLYNWAISLQSYALSADGRFCVLLHDAPANSLIVGCLKRME